MSKNRTVEEYLKSDLFQDHLAVAMDLVSEENWQVVLPSLDAENSEVFSIKDLVTDPQGITKKMEPHIPNKYILNLVKNEIREYLDALDKALPNKYIASPEYQLMVWNNVLETLKPNNKLQLY